MKDPFSGPFLFDTSAEGWFAHPPNPATAEWYRAYTSRHDLHVSAITVLERLRGYSLLWHRSLPGDRFHVDTLRTAWLQTAMTVFPLNTAVAAVAAEIMTLVPHPASRRKRSHGKAESRPDRIARWRFDCMIAATALVSRMTLIHNNAEDFETIRGAIERSPLRFPKLGPLELVRCNAVA